MFAFICTLQPKGTWFLTQTHFPLKEPSSQDMIVGWTWEVACPPVGQACLLAWQISWVSIIFIDYSQYFSSKMLPPPLCRGGHISGRGLPKSITCRWSLLFLSIRLTTFQMQHGTKIFLWNKDLCALFFCGKAFLPFSAFPPTFHFQTLPTLKPTLPQGLVPWDFSLPFSCCKNRELLSSSPLLNSYWQLGHNCFRMRTPFD